MMFAYRSALYVPANKARALEKITTLDADCFILDLEDAVSLQDKALARQQAAQFVAEALPHVRAKLVVRVNGLDSVMGYQDVEAFSEVPPFAFLFPKIAHVDDAYKARVLLNRAAPASALWLMIETPEALSALDALCRSGAAVLVMGWNDMALSLGYAAGIPSVLEEAYGAAVLAAARAAGLIVLDGVENDVRDPSTIERSAQRAARFGFDGKSIIHPSHIAPVHQAFMPSEAERMWAMRVVAAYDPSHGGVVALDGQQIELLHYKQAQRVLRRC